MKPSTSNCQGKCDFVGKRQNYKLSNMTAYRFFSIETIIEKKFSRKKGERPKNFRCGALSARYHWTQRATYFRGARWGFGVAAPPKWPKITHFACSVRCCISH